MLRSTTGWLKFLPCLDSCQVSNPDYHCIHHLTFVCSVPGELPPPRPRACFGRDELIEKIVRLAENLTPIALIGAGGIGKTSIALAVLHDDRVKQRFGDNCRFIRCDQFPATPSHFLRRLSKVIGAGAENPEDLAPLRPFLSSKEMMIVLDNAESILDLRGTSGQEIYTVVEELSQLSNICLFITSHISTIPPGCEILNIPTMSMEAAHDTFYWIYKQDERSAQVSRILEALDFHPLSITLLATVAQCSGWNDSRLTREWERQRTAVLHAQHIRGLAATIELSLASPMFQELGSDARDLLGVVAFFPQGIDEDNIDWLFPTISNRAIIFDKFYTLSLTYRSDGFVTMLAPLRDYLCPQNPVLAPLLCSTKEHYFTRLSVWVDPIGHGFEEARWIVSEDVNVEHLLDVFTTVDEDPGVWSVCAHFAEHLYWHKRRLIGLGPRIERLPDGHPSKPRCLFELSRLFQTVGNYVERRRLLLHALKLWKERGDEPRVAQTLRFLSDAHRELGQYTEGIQHAREALAIYERLDDTVGQGKSLQELASLLYEDKQLEAAEEATSRAINLPLPQFDVCVCYGILGKICHTKGEMEKAMKHFEAGLGIASSFNWPDRLFWLHYDMAKLFRDQSKFEDAHAHIERAKSYAISDAYRLGRAEELQARFWHQQRRLEEAKSGALYAAGVYEKLGATGDLELCGQLLQEIEKAMSDGESLEKVLLPVLISFSIPSPECRRKRTWHHAGWLKSVLPRSKPYTWPGVPFLTAVFPVVPILILGHHFLY